MIPGNRTNEQIDRLVELANKMLAEVGHPEVFRRHNGKLAAPIRYGHDPVVGRAARLAGLSLEGPDALVRCDRCITADDQHGNCITAARALAGELCERWTS